MNVQIDKYGRILLPKAIRQRYQLLSGTQLKLEPENNQLVLKIVQEPPLLEYRGSALVYTGKAEGDMSNILEQIREERNQQLAQSLL